MKQIKSHWKLAYATFIKAIKVTFVTLAQMVRAQLYIMKIEPDILNKRSAEKYFETEEAKWTN